MPVGAAVDAGYTAVDAGASLPRRTHREPAVEIQVHERGGLFDVERVTDVDDTSLTVTADGATTRHELTPEQRSRLHDVARRVLSEPEPVRHRDVPPAVDAVETTIALSDAGRSATVLLRATDEPTQAVLDLLDEVADVGG